MTTDQRHYFDPSELGYVAVTDSHGRRGWDKPCDTCGGQTTWITFYRIDWNAPYLCGACRADRRRHDD